MVVVVVVVVVMVVVVVVVVVVVAAAAVAVVVVLALVVLAAVSVAAVAEVARRYRCWPTKCGERHGAWRCGTDWQRTRGRRIVSVDLRPSVVIMYFSAKQCTSSNTNDLSIAVAWR